MHDIQSDLARFPYKIGSYIRDKVTGMEGTAVVFGVPVSASPRVHVEPRCKEGSNEPPKGIIVDVIRTEFISEGLSEGVPDYVADPKVDFELGDPVKDIVTTVTGTAIERFYHLSGCITYMVVMKAMKTAGSNAENIQQAFLRKDTSKDSLASTFVPATPAGRRSALPLPAFDRSVSCTISVRTSTR